MNWIDAAAAVVEPAVVIALTLSFSTLLAYAVISFVIWMMQPRHYNEADAPPGGFAFSRRVLEAHVLDNCARLGRGGREGGRAKHR